MLELKDTVTFMNSGNYKDRFQAEYLQTKIRYEKLKAFNTKIEAAKLNTTESKVEMPKHDCPDDLLRKQQSVMGEYLHILELRAVIEGISLDGLDKDFIRKCEEASPYILPTTTITNEHPPTGGILNGYGKFNFVEAKKKEI